MSPLQVFASPEAIQSLTPLNPFSRLPDGSPDIFSKQRLAEGRYSALVIDRDWTEDIEEDFRRWRSERK